MNLLVSQLAFVLALTPIAANASSSMVIGREEGWTEVSAKVNAIDVHVRIQVIHVPSTDARNRMCAHLAKPCTAVGELAVIVNGNSLFVPTSSFCSIFDVRSAEIRPFGGEIVLEMKGGDASESYEVEIFMNAERVLRRVVKSTLEPKVVVERTTYFETTLGD